MDADYIPVTKGDRRNQTALNKKEKRLHQKPLFDPGAECRGLCGQWVCIVGGCGQWVCIVGGYGQWVCIVGGCGQWVCIVGGCGQWVCIVGECSVCVQS